MAELKTKQSNASVSSFVNGIEDASRRADCETILALMQKVTDNVPKMWGKSMVGFGEYHYTYASGHEGTWFLTGFSPRKRDLTVYIMPGFSQYSALMKKLGKVRTEKSCLYIKRLEEVDLKVLGELVGRSVRFMAEKYG